MVRVLVVDDNIDSAATMRDFLRANGYECLLAKTGKEALELIQEEPEVVILDIDLPDINGMELLKRFKSVMPGIDVFLVSANQAWETESKAKELGASAFLEKPVELLSLLDLIERIHKKAGGVNERA